jgi:hypothetical protein
MVDPDDWFRLLGMTPEGFDDGLLTRMGQETDPFLKEHPDALPRVSSIIEKTLFRSEDGSTWDDFREGLETYVGTGVPYVLTWLAMAPSERLGLLEKHVPPRVNDFCRTLLSSYAREILYSYQAWREYPGDWRQIRRNAYYDYPNNVWLLKTYIEQYGGGNLTLESSPDSLANLCGFLLDTLTSVGNRDFFRGDSVERLLASMEELHKALSASQAPDSGAESRSNEVQVGAAGEAPTRDPA